MKSKKGKDKKKKQIKSNQKSILENIKSTYILRNIFDYTKDDNFMYKLFVHSKLFQNKLDLNLTKYIARYLLKFKINPKIFLSFDEFHSDFSFGHNTLKRGLAEYLKKNKIDIKSFEIFVKEFFKKEFKDNDDNNYYIDIFSPIFDILLTSKEIFENMFIILKLREIDKNSLDNHYISVFQKLKKNNINYSLFISFYFENEMKFFDNLKIDFSNLKKLSLNFCYDINKTKPNSLKKILFENKTLSTSLPYLHLVCSGETIDYELFQNINNFNLLTELNLERCNFDDTVLLELPNLIKLSISFCNNIALSQSTCLKIKKMFFNGFTLKQLPELYKFPKLEELKCNIQTLDVIDLSLLKNLKKLEINSKTSADLCDIQNNLPSLTSLDIIVKNGKKIFDMFDYIEITEKKDSKVKHFSLILENCSPNVKFYINKFADLGYFKFNINYTKTNLFIPQDYFPFFKQKCGITFNYLRIFEFSTVKNYFDYVCIPFEDLRYFYENLNQFTNLKSFKFRSVSKNIGNNFYEYFIRNLLFLNISEIELELIDDEEYDYKCIASDYTEEELKMIFPLFNSVKYKKLDIKKLHYSFKK